MTTTSLFSPLWIVRCKLSKLRYWNDTFQLYLDNHFLLDAAYLGWFEKLQWSRARQIKTLSYRQWRVSTPFSIQSKNWCTLKGNSWYWWRQKVNHHKVGINYSLERSKFSFKKWFNWVSWLNTLRFLKYWSFHFVYATYEAWIKKFPKSEWIFLPRIFKVPFFAYFNDFNQQKTTFLDHLQFLFNVIVLRIIKQLDSCKMIVNNLFCRKKGHNKKKQFKNLKILEKNIWKNWNSFKNLGKAAPYWGFALLSALYKPH